MRMLWPMAGRSKMVNFALGFALFVAGLGAMIGSFVVSEQEAWSDTARAAGIAVLMAVFIGAIPVGVEGFKGSRDTRIGRKRSGKPEDLSDISRPPTQYAASPASPVHIAANTVLFGAVFVLGVAAAVVLWRYGADAVAAGSEDLEVWPMIALGAAVWAGLIAARAAVGVVTARRAIVVTNDAITLGAAVGFWPPLTLRRSQVVGIADGMKIAAHNRVYEVSQLYFMSSRPAAAVAEAWPEFLAEPGSMEFTEIEAAPPQVADFPGPAVEGVKATLRRRMNTGLAVLVVGLVAAASCGIWYLAQRQATDRLLTEGVVVVATVVDHKDGTLLVPDLLEFGYDYLGESYTGVIASGPFSGYREDVVGEITPIIIDPTNPSQARFGDERNYNPRTWIAAALSLVVLIAGWGIFFHGRRMLGIAEEGVWGRRRIRVVEGKRGIRYVDVAGRTGGGEEGWLRLGQAGGAGKITGEFDAWASEGPTGTVVAIEDPVRVITVHHKRGGAE